MGHVVRKNNRAAGIFGQTIPAIPAPVPIKKEIQNAVKEASEFEVDIHPPDEDTQDILDGLDSLLKLLERGRRADELDFASEKQRLFNLQRNKLRSIVSKSFEALRAMLPVLILLLFL
eukprot:Filipodium_phascolosomae@DN1957_c0_g1_i2.p1